MTDEDIDLSDCPEYVGIVYVKIFSHLVGRSHFALQTQEEYGMISDRGD
ncbi:hypothetical protein ACE1AT_14020 [Pelatocladus sp. BLCC-F211]